MSEGQTCSHRRTFTTSLYKHLKPLEEKLRTRQDKGRYWCELSACAYYHIFEQPKLMYQEIQFHPSYCFDNSNLFSNNKAFFLPTADAYLLAVLNSPLMWWHNWRYLPHMKDEALNPAGVLMKEAPIALTNESMSALVEPSVARLVEIVEANQQARRAMMEWLRVEFEVEVPGQRLE